MDTTTARTATPAEVDAAINELDQQGSKLAGRLERLNRALNYSIASVHAAEYELERTDIHGKLQDISDQASELEAVWRERGCWTRAYIVAGGHVHSSTRCSTCYPSTRFGWLTELSGMAEVEIVELAGERACTVCYPSAPVDTLQRASKLFHADELEAAARRQALDARKAELAAKRAAAAFGPYRTSGSRETLTTVHAAKAFLTDGSWWTTWCEQQHGPGERHPSFTAQDMAAVAELLAVKLGTTAAGELEAAAVRARKRK